MEKDAAEARAAIATANERAAEANRQAAEAKLALEKFKQPRALSPAQQSAIANLLRAYSGTHFDFSVIPSDPEALNLLAQIGTTLEGANWTWVEYNHPTGPFMTVYRIANKPNVGQAGVSVGVRVTMHSDHRSEFFTAAEALAASLHLQGLVVTFDDAAGDDIPNHDTIHIIVGKKPQ